MKKIKQFYKKKVLSKSELYLSLVALSLSLLILVFTLFLNNGLAK